MKYLMMMAGCSTMIGFAWIVLWLESNLTKQPVKRYSVLVFGHVAVMVVVYSLMIFMESKL